RILASLTVAFLVVSLYGRLSTSPFVSSIQADSIKGFLSRLKFKPASILTYFKFPNFTKLFTLQFNSKTNNQNTSSNLPTDEPQPINQIPTDSWQPAPTNSNWPTGKPTPTLPYGVPTKPGLTPTSKPKPTPTKYIKPSPTKPPKPTATPIPPPITSDLRPGTTLAEVFQEVNKRMCFPVALLRAFQTKESGVFFNFNNPSSIIKIYNTYGWWITGAGDPCFGLGYHTQTGIVPPDSVNAGVRCRNAVGDPNDLGIMGILQISQWEQDVSRKNTIATLPKNIDRRVLFDNAIIFASITKNRVGNPPANCNDWPDEAVLIAAEKHLGVCQYNYGNGNAGNYCKEILQLYKQYR
ncbi:MAG: hypothetical protein V1803_01045, partial [Candidatus Roizmanbacteria bacterium]